MENQIIKDPPEFTNILKKLKTTDRGHANVFNALFEVLINNDVFLKAFLEAVKEKSESHIENSVSYMRKLDGIAEGAEVNQFAFSRINVGDLKVTANEKTSTILLQAGSNIEVSVDNITKKILISANRDGGNADKLDGYHAEHFATANHGHDERYYTESEVNTLLNGKSNTNHTHDYANASHTHDDRYYTESEINTLLNGKSNTNHTHGYANASHTHDERYYTESEVNTLLNGKSNTSHTHDYISTGASCNKNWNWSGQEGQPNWLWGGNEINNMYVYNPRNFHVNYADSAGSASSASSATSAGKLTTNAGSSMQPVYFSGGVPVATSVRGVAIQSSTPSNTAVLWAW